MTLIVGVRTPNRVQLFSDTLIAHPDVTQAEELPGRLKLIVLNPSICLGYAGPTNRAIDAIRSLAGKGLSFSETVGALQTASEDGEIDFLAAQSIPTLELTKIERGRSTSVAAEAWIGDAEGAKDYQQRAISARRLAYPDPDMAILGPATSAFNALVQERTVESVGGLPIRATSRPDGFHYLDQALAYYPPQTIPPGVSTTLTFGGPAEGGFAYSVLVPNQAGVPIVAVHFFQGRLGYVYAPLDQDKPLEVPNVTHSDLGDFVAARYGYRVDGVHVG